MENNIFICKTCGSATDIAPSDGSGAICYNCCEDHNYAYESGEHRCVHCNMLAPYDWGIYDE